MRQWRPRLEVKREARQFGVGVREGVEQVALRARVHHEAKNWLFLTDCSNAFNMVKWTSVHAEAATCAPARTPFIAKCYGERPAPVFFQTDSGEKRRIDCSSGLQQGDAMRPALFCMPLLSVLKRTREEFEPKGVEAFAYLDDIIIGMRYPLTLWGLCHSSSESWLTLESPSTPMKRLLCRRKGTFPRWTKLPFLKALTSVDVGKPA